ncbi:MAG: histidinol-phosphate transaminase [Kiritimatiellae bacterium]|nr:histidinol-phosphate transaminase [Kiritimatiellia bacterium]
MNPHLKSLVKPSVQALHAYVPGEQPRDPDLLKLNTNENPYPPSPDVFAALASVTADDLRRYPHPSAAPLRQAIANLHGLAPENVFIGNGSDEVLALFTRAYAPHGGTLGYMSPSYSLYPILGAIAELDCIPYPLNPDFTWTVPDTLDVDLFFLTQPNAPTSLALSPDDIRAAANRCRGVFLVDEAYVDFAEESALPLLAECPNLMISRSFSKSYSLAGLRVGYTLGAAPLIEALDKIKDSYNLDHLAQRIALAAVNDQSTLVSNTTAVRGTRAAAKKQLEARGFDVLDSQTNFLFAKVPPGHNAADLHEALRARHVYIRHFPGPQTGSHLRITIGTDTQMDRFFEVLDSIIGNK